MSACFRLEISHILQASVKKRFKILQKKKVHKIVALIAQIDAKHLRVSLLGALLESHLSYNSPGVFCLHFKAEKAPLWFIHSNTIYSSLCSLVLNGHLCLNKATKITEGRGADKTNLMSILGKRNVAFFTSFSKA